MLRTMADQGVLISASHISEYDTMRQTMSTCQFVSAEVACRWKSTVKGSLVSTGTHACGLYKYNYDI